MSKQKGIRDSMLHTVEDRRQLSFVPDPTLQRTNNDRRNNMQDDAHRPEYARFAGMRYEETNLFMMVKGKNGIRLRCRCANISQTGVKLYLPEYFDSALIEEGDTLRLRFELEPGMLQEGTEKKYRLKSKVVRIHHEDHWIALQFAEPLYKARRGTSNLYFTLAEQYLGHRIAAKKGELQLIYFVNGVIDEVLNNGTYLKWIEDAQKRADELGL